MNDDSPGIGSSLRAISLTAVFAVAVLKIIAPNEFDYASGKLNDDLGDVFKADQPTIDDYDKKISLMQDRLGDKIASQCKNIAENADYSTLSDGTSLFQAGQIEELRCLMRAKRTGAVEAPEL